MSLKAKYQYTHFIYPFVVENNNYQNFLKAILENTKDFKMKLDEHQVDEELYNFFLPYMRKFLFPTLFWDKVTKKDFKALSPLRKSMILSKTSCVRFEYKLSNIKTGSLSPRQYGIIDYDIIKIDLICFEPGICFLDIKTEIDDDEQLIEFNKILDFNHHFRNLTPRAISTYKDKDCIKGKNIDKAENISGLIEKIVKQFESNKLEKMYYDKMFTYSYVCVDDWNEPGDFDKMKNDFLKFQYVMDSKSTAIFSDDCQKLKDNMYHRWEYSMFGFSRESGVVFVSDKEKYNITRMPYNFEKTYFYMLLLAFYQRISLINFSQEIMKRDKTMVAKLNSQLNKFTHMSWFSQISNSEHGMDVWKCWQNAFKLPELFDEVHKEYLEYYDYVKASKADRFDIVLIIMYIVNVALNGISMMINLFDVRGTWLEPLTIILMIISISSYPVIMFSRWIKHKLEARMNS